MLIYLDILLHNPDFEMVNPATTQLKKNFYIFFINATNPLIARHLSGSPTELRHLFGAKGFPPTHTIDFAHLTLQQFVQL